MNAEIYYFSASGNSLSIAKHIAEKINGTLISIPAVMKKEGITPNAEVIGLVFPVYYATNDCGIPAIVGRFISKLECLDSKYIFAICTCGYMSGETIENLKAAVASRGGKLACGFTVRMSNKNLPSKKQQKLAAQQKKKLETIADYIAAGKKGKFETRNVLSKIAFAPLLQLAIKPAFSRRYRKLSGVKQHLPFRELVPLADKSYQPNQKCIGCGVCARVCPVDNIRLVEGRPEWLHHCETCYACYVWCPKGAIGGEIVAYNEQFHHPDVKLSDMIR